MFSVEDASAVHPDFKAIPALVMPYFDASGEVMTWGADAQPFCRVRYLDPPAQRGFVATKPQRYAQPKGSGCHAYFAPIVDWRAVRDDPRQPVVLTEGEKKGLAGVLQGFPVVALGGVYNFMDGEALLPELDAFNWKGRDVYVCFDSDAVTNPNILAAEARLVDELQRRRGAHCFLVRLPQPHSGGVSDAKVGLDDFLAASGAAAFESLISQAPALGALDAKVVALNKSCAWIERESLVYDLETRLFIQKDAFTNGSRFSALEHITVGGKQRTAPKHISVAATWLKHPHAQRFREILFRPGEGRTCEGEHGATALNMWEGWETEPGDVTPFLQLSEFLFSNMAPEHRDLPLKLLAYKAQHPDEKIPLALVLIGQQGCGKTLWGETVRDAFAPYGVDVTPSSLSGEFQGWLERSLVALINEAKGEDILKASETLKALISDLKRPMNEKYRPVRQVNTYTSYIITSNRRAVGSYSADDRRMIVVDCPNKMTTPEGQALYDTLGQRTGAWYHGGGPKHLLHYLLHLDLKGWRPPASAPMTPEKYLAYMEALTPVQRLAEDMRTASEHTIKLWLDQACAWARIHELSNNTGVAAMARATLENVAGYHIRPWYTPEELALMFPAIMDQMLGSKYDKTTPSGRISRELREAGVPYLVNADDPRGFKWKGQIRQYLVVAEFDDWQAPLHQADFERLMAMWPTYAQLTQRRVA
ncbi:MAG TPA: DUF3854 domain-containing protein [Ktedonobacterales bacterium]|nr:DUF3854 domain-containing protein [Ktedonobacterales bacterium]